MAEPRIVLITGATAGLGLEIVKALAGSSHPYKIIVAGRSPDKVAAAIDIAEKLHPSSSSKLSALTLDIESDESISKAAAEVEKSYGRLDVLINNAGAQADTARSQGLIDITEREAFAKNWDVNVTGAHLLTAALAPYLAKSTKGYLLFMVSGTGSLTESEHDEESFFNKPAPAGFPKPPSLTSYRAAKTGLNMVMRDWARLLKNDGILVWGISPGFLATGLGISDPERLRKMGALDPSVGGKFVAEVVEGKREADAGKAIRADAVQPW